MSFVFNSFFYGYCLCLWVTASINVKSLLWLFISECRLLAQAVSMLAGIQNSVTWILDHTFQVQFVLFFCFLPYRIFILFCSILLYSTLLYSTLLYSTLLYSTLFYSILFLSILLYSILFYFILFSFILFYFIHFILFCFCYACTYWRLISVT